MSEYLLHIGYHKTASTLLQKFVWPAIGSHANYARHEPWVLDQFIKYGRFPSNPRALREKFAHKDNKVNIVSSEAILFNPYERRGFEYENIWAASQAFPNAKVLVIFREQKSWIRSWYKHLVRSGSSIPPEELIATETRPGFAPALNLECLKYDAVYNLLSEFFSHEQIIMLPFEWIVHKPRHFIDHLALRLGIDIDHNLLADLPVQNPGYSASALGLARYVNQLLRHSERDFISKSAMETLRGKLIYRLNQYIPKSQAREAELSRTLSPKKDFFLESNQRLQKLLNINLKALGYQVVPESEAEHTSDSINSSVWQAHD